MEDKFEYSKKVVTMVGSLLEGKRELLHEYYKKVNSDRDKHILGNLKIYIYGLDRDQMTPHAHLIDDDVELEVSLIDWRIVRVKPASSKNHEWSAFTSIRDRFFEWLENEDNSDKLFRTWNNNNPDNLLEEYKNEYVSKELRFYFMKQSNPIILDDFRKAIYDVLQPLFADKKTKEKLNDLDPMSLLKEVGLYERYHLEDTNEDVIRTAEDAIRDVKIWFSYV